MKIPDQIEKKEGCIASTLAIFGDRWTGLIVRDIAGGTKRFSQLEHSLTGISPRTLSQRLDMLQNEKIVTKVLHAEVPPRVEYSLTAKGRELIPILQTMANWGLKYHR